MGVPNNSLSEASDAAARPSEAWTLADGLGRKVSAAVPAREAWTGGDSLGEQSVGCGPRKRSVDRSRHPRS